MKTTKLFFMAALALMTAACSNDDNEVAKQQAGQPDNNMITITAKLAPKSSTTRAVSDKGDDKITVDWAVDEHLAILYEVSSTKYAADARITDVDASGNATITFAVQAGTADDTPCTLVYPAKLTDGTTTVYKDDLSGVKDAATLLAAQDGTLSANLDVRVGEGTIQTTTPGLTVSTQPEAQFAIFKFDTQDLTPSGIPVSEFKVSDGSGNVITTVTPSGTPFYVALPAMAAGTYWFNATYSGKPYIAKATVTTATTAGKFYTTTVKMATIGDVILSDGKFAARSSTGTKVAMIAYLGSETDHATYKHGLALALSDEGSMNWSTAKSTCESKTAITGAKWCLPSQDQWKQMFKANGGNEGSYNDLNTTITNAGGTTLQAPAYYWSSSELITDGPAFVANLYNGSASWASSNKDKDRPVRACLAF